MSTFITDFLINLTFIWDILRKCTGYVVARVAQEGQIFIFVILPLFLDEFCLEQTKPRTTYNDALRGTLVERMTQP
jgi:hypothetical protein